MKREQLLLLLSTIILFTSCSSAVKYQSTISIEEQKKLNIFDDVQKSIVKITASSYYKNYYYYYPETEEEALLKGKLLYNTNLTTNSVAGTGLIVYQDHRKQYIITCQHVFDFQDTIKTFYLNEREEPTNHLKSLSIRVGQQILIYHKNGQSTTATVLAEDSRNDIALIETEIRDFQFSEKQFSGIYGDADRLQFGQEVYLLGFPKGFFMITHGLVSPTQFKNKYLIDAPFNRGFSGGVVIRMTTTEPYFEYVGMANSISYSSEFVLSPVEDMRVIERHKFIPYKEDIFTKEIKHLNYGITYVIKSGMIIDFLKEHAKGVDLQEAKIDSKTDED
ncbi:trypsin-like peptidase domain-containing protein [candidate division KSB1 bacterium]|nr:trypsin-like peptidase domain-containing protein [candidate division KSB1 bacterium]